MVIEQRVEGITSEAVITEDAISLHRRVVRERVEDFLTRYNIKAVVGVCGGADESNTEYTSTIINDFLWEFRGKNIAILSGGTEGGVPELATKIAHNFSFPAIGVFPVDGRKYALLDQLDLAIESLPPSYGKAGFGTETPTFVELAQAVMVIGGEFGTLVEVGTLLKVNKDKVKKNKEMIYLCPIKGTGGVADMVNLLPGIERVRICLPEEDIYTGAAAAHFLKGRLFGIEELIHGVN